jgi:hypothetical protein
MARGGAGEQRSNSVDGLPAAANHAADIALPKLKFENGCSAARNFREHHVVGIFNQLPNHELEKFSHDGKANHECTRIDTNFCRNQKPTRSPASFAKAAKSAAAAQTSLRPRR